ncbi:hypothetical protein M6B38_312975 [Iris pallida]|uniref:Uncharacterized protein n=1 Tax=Iris pallida TaxID=29817 RepID=A0AAX6HGJ8_IRIPA|nr:hypothetical protein M6B38_312975 [Iris pallida]
MSLSLFFVFFLILERERERERAMGSGRGRVKLKRIDYREQDQIYRRSGGNVRAGQEARPTIELSVDRCSAGSRLTSRPLQLDFHQ